MMNMPYSIGSIYNLYNKTGINTNYINVILQSLISLSNFKRYFLSDLIKNFYNSNNLYTQKYPFSFQIHLLVYKLYTSNSSFIANVEELINLYYMQLAQKGIEENSRRDPYHFLYYFLSILHDEMNLLVYNNNVSNSQFNYITNNDPMIETSKPNMFELFYKYYLVNQKSFIFDEFFTTRKLRIQCDLCCQITYKFESQTIYMFDINLFNSYKKNKNKILTLDECFDYDVRGNKIKNIYCKFCRKTTSGLRWNHICIPSNVIIIYYKRNPNFNESHLKDVTTPLQMNIRPYIDEEILNFFRENDIKLPFDYMLRTVITFDGQRYSAYCRLRGNYNQDYNWFKYTDNEKKFIQNFENENYEPVLLFYEYKPFLVPNNCKVNETKKYLVNQDINNDDKKFLFPIQNMDYNNSDFFNPYVLNVNHKKNQKDFFESKKIIQMSHLMNNMLTKENISSQNFGNNNNDLPYNPDINIFTIDTRIEDRNYINFYIKFIIVEEYGPRKEGKNNCYFIKVNGNSTINDTINAFLGLSKLNTGIIKMFEYNGKILYPSNEKISLLNFSFNEQSIIFVILKQGNKIYD